MLKLAILGGENSHAWSFSALIDGKDGTRIFDDIELLGVYADQSTQDGQNGIEEIKKSSNCIRFAQHHNDFVSEADVVMVTARHGANHLKFAREYIKKGIPVWIDKPTTCSTEEVCELIELAKKHNSLLYGGSGLSYTEDIKELSAIGQESIDTLKGGHVTAPVSMENQYGGFWFYAQHLIQMLTSVFGYEVKSVFAEKGKSGVNAIYHYDNFDVSAYFGTGYSVTIYMSDWTVITKEVSLGKDFYRKELEAFYKNLKSGKPEYTPREFAMPIYLIEATIKSFEEKRNIRISNPF